MAKSPIPVYAAEIKAGLAEAVASQNTVAYLTAVLQSPATLNKQLVTAQMAAAQAAFGSGVSFDLFPVHTIMVTTGWNKNDDIFTKGETWAARFTPEDKPFNIGHKPRQIIGHITANTVVDDTLTIIDDGISFDDVPDKFHILTSAVVYRHLNSRDESLEAEAAELIEGIQSGNWFVSMECLFGGFDYGVTYASGDQQVVARNAKTAFLTKHLRIQGGCGEYNGGRLGRVLRNITFSGKGLVDKPANPESVILNDVKRFVGVFASEWQEQPISVAHINPEPGDNDMADNDKYASQLETHNAELSAALAKANERIEELGEARVKSVLAEKDGIIAKLTDELAASNARVAELTESFNGAVAAKEAVEAAKAETEEKLAEATTKLDEVEKAAIATSRISTLVDKGIDKATAETVVAEFAELSDEKFTKVVEMQAQIAKASAPAPVVEEGAAAADAEPDADDPDGEAAAGDADLNNAEPDAEPALAADGTDDKDKVTMQALAAFLDTAMHGKTAGE